MKIENKIQGSRFSAIRRNIREAFIRSAHPVHTEKWQSQSIRDKPEAQMYELLNVSFTVPLLGIENMTQWANDIQPNLPWADDHFEERVCGVPLNPGLQWKKWPWGLKAQDSLGPSGTFNHNYMERYWPKLAGRGTAAETADDYHMLHPYWDAEAINSPNYGLRHSLGDLNDLVALMAEQPLTRQAWMPIFFPEDTGIGDGGRKPCSLGYQFMMRDNGLHIYYPLRSCDFFRHWADDVYLTLKLGVWVLERLRDIDIDTWSEVRMHSFSMHCTSLHMFVNDFISIGGKP